MKESEKPDYQELWNKIYGRGDSSQLGWYEEDVSPTMQLIRTSSIGLDARVLIVGAGATTLVDTLLEEGYRNIIATDISDVALHNLMMRLDRCAGKVEWLVDDLTKPKSLNTINSVDIWIDRAVLHFFTEETDQDTYFTLLRRTLRSGGFVLLAQFSLEGAEMCSGLPIQRYSKEMLQEKLGLDFKLIDSFDSNYTMASGDLRPYVYTLFQRQ
jgi:SAM-dependent methyltransferase